MDLLDHLFTARACVVHDLQTRGLAAPDSVSLVEDVVSQRRWWVEQWPAGAAYVAGLVAQDVQDAMFDDGTRWPVCRTCTEGPEHELRLHPELGPDPYWVCEQCGEVVAPLGRL